MGAMSDTHFQPFSANASEGERAEQCFIQTVFENLLFWYMVQGPAQRLYDMTE